MKARYVRIIISENDATKVSLQLPIATLDWLETLMPDHVLEKIKVRGIDIEESVKKAKSNNLEVQELFTLRENKKTYSVSLE